MNTMSACAALLLTPDALKSKEGKQTATALRGRVALGIWEGNVNDVPDEFRHLPLVHKDDSDEAIMSSLGLDGETIDHVAALVGNDENLVTCRDYHHRPKYIFHFNQLPEGLRRLARI